MGAMSTLVGADLGFFVEALLCCAMAVAALYALTTLYFARIHKFKLPGPVFVPPLIGNIVAMIRDPTAFWDKQAAYSPNGVSWQSILNQFTVFATDADTCHRIFNTNGKDSLTLVLHPNGRIILGENNIAFQSGPTHKALRASFLNLFSQKALSLYLPIQERIVRRHLDEWIKKFPKGGKHEEMRTHIRDMNCETSQTVFLGTHLHNRERFTEDYNLMTIGFLSAPIYFPGTALYKAVQARHRAMKQLEDAVRRSKEYMVTPGAEPQCLLDFWTARILEEIAAAKDQGVPPPPYSNDHEMADTMMDFLFASQDASTASLASITATMFEHPDILARVVEEQRRVRPHHETLTYDLVQEMTFTRQAVLEQLRIRPPAPMVPMLAHAPFQVNDDFVAPKGSLVIPSLVGACRQGFPNPDKYDPDRMGPERQEDRKFSKEFIPFGVGPHRCVGYNYAIQHLTVFLAVVASTASWERLRTKDSDRIMYLPTLYPWDCLITWEYREDYVRAMKERGTPVA